jgi:hypothetical protein
VCERERKRDREGEEDLSRKMVAVMEEWRWGNGKVMIA